MSPENNAVTDEVVRLAGEDAEDLYDKMVEICREYINGPLKGWETAVLLKVLCSVVANVIWASSSNQEDAKALFLRSGEIILEGIKIIEEKSGGFSCGKEEKGNVR
jgi:hypothetical protein